MVDPAFQGNLFTNDFLCETIATLPEWSAFDDSAAKALASDLSTVFQRFPTSGRPNEAQTEDDLIWKVLGRLGWADWLRNQNLTLRGRDDVPDGLLFASAADKSRANGFHDEWKRYEFGLAIVESKRWARPLDRQSGARGEETAPSTQMLRYLRRVDDITGGKLRWGILTNGGKWRLYYQGARSVSEQFLEIDLAAVLGVPGHEGGLFALPPEARTHWLKVFALMFAREAFLPSPTEQRTFHQVALDQGRFYEERVAADLSRLVFGFIFPALAQAIAAAAPASSLDEVRDSALILLYRLLFILYAEDRGLLPVNDRRYQPYGFRQQVRAEVGRRKDQGDAFSTTATRYWTTVDELCRAIDLGDSAIGLPPYNGGLFDPGRTPLLTQIRLSDSVMAEVVDNLSFEKAARARKYINYRDLGVQQLGSIYERLLERRVTRQGDDIRIEPNIFARKSAGGYYTHDDLVNLIVRETIDPLVGSRMEAFAAKAEALETSDLPLDQRLGLLAALDPAEKLLELKVCDPAMGSGHFLVGLVDYLADRVISAMADAAGEAAFGEYISPLVHRIAAIRTTIQQNATQRGWTVSYEQLDDRHIVRRMVLKRCVYGVDKNPMAVELAKVALWLHTFTVGAPLSFLDHHLRCGDSLFGSWVRKAIDRAAKLGAPLFLHESVTKALRAAAKMQAIERLTDAEIAEAHLSKTMFEEVVEMTAPLDALLSVIHALEWLGLKAPEDKAALAAFFTGQFGDPVLLATGKLKPAANLNGPNGNGAGVRKQLPPAVVFARFQEIWTGVRTLVTEERFLNWQVVFPGVWSNWEAETLLGGFDAVIGNPPWDRMKLQQVEWFAGRKPEIAMAQRASDRKAMIEALEAAGDPLWGDYAKASGRAETAVRVAREGDDYPLLSGGDVNLYSLFVERAMTLIKPSGMAGLLTPSGIASDLTAAPFFKRIATGGRLKALYDFENKKVFFPDIHASFKFCVFVASPTATPLPAKCAFYLHSVTELHDPDRCFPLTAEDFARVNPNTGTAPIFRTRRDAELTTAIYARLSVLVDRSSGAEVKAWPVRYFTMFHMTNDSGLFRTRKELEEKEGAYPIGANRYRNAAGEFVPLYEGKMVQAFDHRAASVIVNPANQHRPAQPAPATPAQHANPAWLPDPQFWVALAECGWTRPLSWVLAFKEITAPTNVRTLIAALIPQVAFGNKIPILKPETTTQKEYYLSANLNSIVLDYILRQKIQGQTINLFILEQLPVVLMGEYDTTSFGSLTVGDIVRAAVLELTYTAHDMAPFAGDMGYVDETGNVKPPFVWDEDRRLKLRAKLDAVYFHLYGVTDRDDVRYIYSTFPIVERQEMKAFGRYRSRDLCLATMNALAAGDPDADIDL